MQKPDFEPRDVLQKLEFDKIIELLQKEVLTPLAAERLKDLGPVTDYNWVDLRLRETAEFKLTLEKNDRFPLGVFDDISEELGMLSIEGYTLQPDYCKQLLRVLFLTRDIFRYFSSGQKDEIYPRLYDIVRQHRFDEELIKAIDAVFNEEGEIRPDASPELQRIRKSAIQKQRELDTRFRTVIQDYRQKGWLADTTESFRNGRRVLAVAAEHKRKIRGIIHDESDTGRTAFIEPESVIEVNNDIFDLENEERREIMRILRELSATIRPYGPQILGYQELLITFDLIRAKAKLAVALRANMPVLKKKPVIGLRKAYHPLLYLKNKGLKRKTIPMELKLDAKNHILILSGPNAGGKSVSMKTVGLLQLMVQSGLLVPTHEMSEFGIFNQIFADIGDQQSLDDDLSTYSSRLKNATAFLEKANHETLVLIDEMGSGTDPKPGGAIAEAILRGLYNKGVFGVMTTHYSNLKVFAFRHHGVLNGNMHFDKDTLSPSYELRVGRPGSSYAFEIAGSSGLPKHVIDQARKRTGNETAVDDILIELQNEKQELEETLREVKGKEEMLERLIKTYDKMQDELEIKRKRLKLDQKEFEMLRNANKASEIDKVIKQLKEEKKIDEARKLSNKLKEERADKAREVDEIHSQVLQLENKGMPSEANRPLAEGDFVRLRAGGATGEIEELKNKKAIVLMGGLRLTVNLRDLVRAKEPAKTTVTKSANVDQPQQSAVNESKLDLRGMSQQEALEILEKFVDNALLSNSSSLHILHGKGSGVLRKVVRHKLKEYGSNITNVYHPEPENGGDGVTIVELI